MSFHPARLPADVLGFLAERHVGTLSTVAGDGRLHVVAIAFTFDVELALVRLTTNRGSVKARHARGGGRAAVCQVDGPRWLSLEGPVTTSEDPGRVAAAVEAHGRRYRVLGPNPDRIVVEIAVERVLGRASV